MNDRTDALRGPWLTMDASRARGANLDVAESLRLAYRVAFSVLRHRQDAEDVAQDAVLKACRKSGQLRDPSRLRAWLVRTAWRTALDHQTAGRRRAAREQANAAADSGAAASPEDVAAVAQQARRLWGGIDGLPEKLRLVVILNAIEEHDVAAVAETLGIPEGTVKSRLFEARRLLRERLDDLRSR
jgi:RNA polymerase sigma-70 factor (ECF subfamily)